MSMNNISWFLVYTPSKLILYQETQLMDELVIVIPVAIQKTGSHANPILIQISLPNELGILWIDVRNVQSYAAHYCRLILFDGGKAPH